MGNARNDEFIATILISLPTLGPETKGKKNMLFDRYTASVPLWGIFFSFSALTYAISVSYEKLTPYLTAVGVDAFLIFFALICLCLAIRLFYIYGIKLWTVALVFIGLKMSWSLIVAAMILKLADLLY